MFLQYQEFAIEQRQKDGYVNGTAMAKANNVRIGHWLENAKTKSYTQALAVDVGYPASKLIEIRKGGDSTNQGTWLHPLLALHFGRWISDPFAIWCDRHIKILIETGETKLGDVPIATQPTQCDLTKPELPGEAIAILYSAWNQMTVDEDFLGIELSSGDRSRIILEKVKGEMSCAEFSRFLGVEYSSLWRCLHGQVVTLAIAVKLSRTIGCTLDDLAHLVFPSHQTNSSLIFQ
jgi:hypothetical protein